MNDKFDSLSSSLLSHNRFSHTITLSVVQQTLPIYIYIVMSWFLGKKSNNPMSPDYVPNLFAHTSESKRERQIYASSRFEMTQLKKHKKGESWPWTTCFYHLWGWCRGTGHHCGGRHCVWAKLLCSNPSLWTIAQILPAEPSFLCWLMCAYG